MAESVVQSLDAPIKFMIAKTGHIDWQLPPDRFEDRGRGSDRGKRPTLGEVPGVNPNRSRVFGPHPLDCVDQRVGTRQGAVRGPVRPERSEEVCGYDNLHRKRSGLALNTDRGACFYPIGDLIQATSSSSFMSNDQISLTM